MAAPRSHYPLKYTRARERTFSKLMSPMHPRTRRVIPWCIYVSDINLARFPRTNIKGRGADSSRGAPKADQCEPKSPFVQFRKAAAADRSAALQAAIIVRRTAKPEAAGSEPSLTRLVPIRPSR